MDSIAEDIARIKREANEAETVEATFEQSKINVKTQQA